MVDISHRIIAFTKFGEWLRNFSSNSALDNKEYSDLNKLISKAAAHNGWFTREHILYSIKNWGFALTEKKLTEWTSNYSSFTQCNDKTIGVIMAGNLPLVGFHDFLSVIIAGFNVDIKLSSDDDIILPFLIDKLIEFEPTLKEKIIFSVRLNDVDAVIATGSNNTARYFESYFGKYPHIIRKNRTSVAILTGKESDEQIQKLADDLFIYFGLGCRNVTKLFLPEGFDLDRVFRNVMKYSHFIDHNKYVNNYDYYRAIYLLNQDKFLENGFLILKEEERFSTPVAVIHYEYYKDLESVKQAIIDKQESIQCVVSDSGIIDNAIYFGNTQNPALTDYADGVNTLDFLASLIKA